MLHVVQLCESQAVAPSHKGVNPQMYMLECFLCVFQISELALEVAILYYGGHLVITNQMSSGALIAFFIYMLELGESLEVCRN